MADISQITLLNGDVVNLKDSAGREAAATGLAGKVNIAQGIQNQGKILQVSSGGTLELVSPGEGSGDVSGPDSSVDEHVATFDGTTGKIIQDSGFTIGTSVPSDAVFTDTTYESKNAEDGGTDVSLVTTGEKYTWNNKTSNTGTVTGVKMNNGSSIAPDSNGVVDLGTVITSHQDISGKADLDENGKVPSSQLPSYVDDVLEYASSSSFPLTGESGKIYVALDVNKTYRWSGSEYVEISASLALGETSATAYRGDRGAAAYAAAVTNVDSTPTTNSTHLITSGGVKAALPSDMTAASASANGVHGLVPAPGSGKQASFLRGDATWAVPTNTTYAAATQSANGLMSSADKTKLDGIATGATANTGTITGIKMNGASKGTSGVVDLGTVITSHQDISGKKNTQSAVSDPTADGTSATFIATITQNAQGVITPTKKTVRTMSAASASANGATGLVPAPGSGKQASFLRGDATWAIPTNTTYANASENNAGLVSTGTQTFAGAKTFKDNHISISSPSVDLSKSNNNISSGTIEKDFVVKDVEGRSYCLFGALASSSGKTTAAMGVKNHDGTSSISWQGITVNMDKAGTVTYTVSTPANFRSAIGVNTMGAASASANGTMGLVPAPGSGKQSMFLRGDATWATPTNTTYADFTKATSSANGTHGLVPAPASGKQASFLRGDATWAVPTNTTYADFTAATSAAAGAHGLVPAPGSGKQASYLRGDKSWATPTNTTYADFTAATSAAAGTHGLVPAPGSGKQTAFLRGDKTWTALGAAASKGVWDKSSATAMSSSDTNLVTTRSVYNAIYNGLDKSAAGFALDARQGATLKSHISTNNQLYTGVVNVKTGSTVTLSESASNYQFLQLYFSTDTSVSSGARFLLLIPVINSDVNGWYPLSFNEEYGGVRLYVSGTSLQILDTKGFASIYLYRVYGIIKK